MSLSILVGAILMPPVGLVLLALLGAILGRAGRLLVAGACVLQLLLATPLVSRLLVASLDPPLITTGPPPGAIVVLAAETTLTRGGVEIGPLTLERLRAAAALHRATGLPLLVTGGSLGADQPPVAALMARSLREDFSAPVRWVEDRALDTWQNARFSAAILSESGIESALIVSHGWHLPRAVESARRHRLFGWPAPVRAEGWRALQVTDLLPRADRWATSWLALREWVGRAAYAFY